MSQNDADLDPFGPWRSFRDATMDVWAKSMAEAVNTEAFAQNMGAYLNTYLATSAPLQKFIEQYMETTLARLSMPSRDEVIDLARRMTSIEMRLDDLDAKTDLMLRRLRSQPTATPPAPSAPVEARLERLEDRVNELLILVQAMPIPTPTLNATETRSPNNRRNARSRKTAEAEEPTSESVTVSEK